MSLGTNLPPLVLKPNEESQRKEKKEKKEKDVCPLTLSAIPVHDSVCLECTHRFTKSKLYFYFSSFCAAPFTTARTDDVEEGQERINTENLKCPVCRRTLSQKDWADFSSFQKAQKRAQEKRKLVIQLLALPPALFSVACIFYYYAFSFYKKRDNTWMVPYTSFWYMWGYVADLLSGFIFAWVAQKTGNPALTGTFIFFILLGAILNISLLAAYTWREFSQIVLIIVRLFVYMILVVFLRVVFSLREGKELDEVRRIALELHQNLALVAPFETFETHAQVTQQPLQEQQGPL